MQAVTLGLRAQRGGAVAVAVAVESGAPVVAWSGFMATAAEGDRLAFEPYHVAFATERNAEGLAQAEAAVAEGRRRQAVMAGEALERLLAELRRAGRAAAGAALLVNRAGWISDLLGHSLSHPEHPPIAEGLAVREALRGALGARGLTPTEIDEKGLPQAAEAALGLSGAEIEARLAGLREQAGRPWRKEQKLACLAAWTTAAAPAGPAR